MNRIALCQLEDIPIGLGRAFEVNGREVAVFRGREGQVFAIDGRCPHKNGPLADGMLIGDQVVCPLHGYRYRGFTGECDQPNACSVAAYPSYLENGTVYIQVPAS